MQGRLFSIACVVAVFSGCAESPPSPPLSVAAQPPLGKGFDSAKSGSIAGDVDWVGAVVPRVAPFRSIPTPFSDQPPMPARDYANPNSPVIDPASGAVGSAVVFLRSVDPERSRPWDLEPARVELVDQRIEVHQGTHRGPVGFVRVGDAIEIVSRDSLFHSIQGRGASFFARTMPTPDEVRTRTLSKPGVVELQSGAGYFWMRGYLLVADHPYHVHADARGKFLLKDVPAGEYDLVAWHPDWRVSRSVRNPDSARIQQVTYREPIQASRRVVVEAGKTTSSRLELSSR